MDFLRAAFVLPLFLSVAFAICSDYAQIDCNVFNDNAAEKLALAHNETDNNTVYTYYTSAANEYKKAGECLKCAQNAAGAETYLNFAIQNYLEATDFLSTSGDFQFRGESYEFIGDAYLLMNTTAKCTEYYSLAKDNFQHANNAARVAGIDAKLSALSAPTQVQKPQEFDWLLMLSGIGTVLILIAAVLFILQQKKGHGPIMSLSRMQERRARQERQERPEKPEKQERPERSRPATILPPDTPLKSLKDNNAERRTKDKIREKIRQKYGLP